MNKQWVRLLLITCAVAALNSNGPAIGQDKASDAGAKACFAALKKLTGDWYGIDPKTGKERLVLRYAVISGGTAVQEVILPGSQYDMTSIYHMDNGSIGMTHYCSMGNQPYLKSTAASTPTKLEFICTGERGGNMKSENDMHIHHVIFNLTSSDKFTAVWSANSGGKPSAGDEKFDVHRKKK